jgi:hypothetical protein
MGIFRAPDESVPGQGATRPKPSRQAQYLAIFAGRLGHRPETREEAEPDPGAGADEQANQTCAVPGPRDLWS